MPRKVRELRAELRQAGFVKLKGRAKGSHTFWRHPAGPVHATLSGADSADAQAYQEKHVAAALAAVVQHEERSR